MKEGLCRTLPEFAFVESLIVHFSHQLVNLGATQPKATRDQLRAIMRERHGLELDNKQFERLKEKYITRPEKTGGAAKRHELLVQVVTGGRRRGMTIGAPSEYRLTGLLDLLELPGDYALTA